MPVRSDRERGKGLQSVKNPSKGRIGPMFMRCQHFDSAAKNSGKSRESGTGLAQNGNKTPTFFVSGLEIRLKREIYIMARGRKRTPLRDPSVIATDSPGIIEIAWLAGFYEGEGCCTIVNNQFTLMIGQANREPLDKIKRFFGGKVYQTATHPTSGTVYYWKVNYERAEGIAFTIFTFLSIEKKSKIVSMLAKYRALCGLSFPDVLHKEY